MSEGRFHVAIVGGGLCGLALAIALTKRNVSFTIYEAKASFTELGAGLNLGPNTIHAFDAIDATLCDQIFDLATRNKPDKEVWLNIRLGAPTNEFEDGHLITGILAPPTGNMTVSRNELLQLLASSMNIEHAKFNKKIDAIQQSEDGVVMTFADGSQESASAVVGCDGAHSTVRRLMLGREHPAAEPKYSGTGGYRAIFPIGVHEQAVGVDKAYMGQAFCGPGGYVIMYPINGGKNMNIGFWKYKSGEWEHPSWILSRQKTQMLKDFEAWGPTTQKMMSFTSEETQFWATFYHAQTPEHYFDRRVSIIGDAAHSMPPHQGQGAAQAMEDACVMGEVLQNVDALRSDKSLSRRIEAAFSGFEAARRERFEAVGRTSAEAIDFWAKFWRQDLTQYDISEFEKAACKRFEWIWAEDIAGQCQAAVAEMSRLLTKTEMNGHDDAKSLLQPDDVLRN